MAFQQRLWVQEGFSSYNGEGYQVHEIKKSLCGLRPYAK